MEQIIDSRHKCRIYDKCIGEMCYDVCIGFIKDGITKDCVIADTSCGQITYIDKRLNDIEIMQCTGLKDKNKKLIYEGDILKDKYGALHPVSWNVKGFYEADTFAVAGFYNTIQEDMEVIGNIYEDKELLEGV